MYVLSDLLATNLPLFPGRLQLSVALRVDRPANMSVSVP